VLDIAGRSAEVAAEIHAQEVKEITRELARFRGAMEAEEAKLAKLEEGRA